MGAYDYIEDTKTINCDASDSKDIDSVKRYYKGADLKTRKIKEGKLWSSTVKNLRNRHCYCQMRYR